LELTGLKIVAFESRMASQMADALARHGGQAFVAPSMREVPDEDPTPALAFAEKLIAGQFDAVILLTGVGTRHLIKSVSAQYPPEQIADALRSVTLVARGPKPVAALREIGLTADIVAPSPNTWREVISALTQAQDLAGKRIAIQEYGQSNQELTEALENSGATITSVQTYRWQLPEDLGPLKSAIQLIIDGNVDVAVFTSAQQIRHLFQVAKQDALDAELRAAFGRVMIASVGPSCTEAIRSLGLAPDDEPDTPNMGSLIKGLVRHGIKIIHRKRLALAAGVDTTAWRRVDMVWTGEDTADTHEKLHQSAFLKACRREPTDHTPIWLMRQAGRFQRAYRDIRAKVPFIELCKTPELAAEVTLTAVDQLDVDAAIIFSDILLIVEPMGIGLQFNKGEGPSLANPIREPKDVDRLTPANAAESMTFLYEAIRLTRRALPPTVPLIGFAGAPFTLASYICEGGGSRDYVHTKSLMYRDADAWNTLMAHLVDNLADYLKAQVAAGAQALQLFDSWVGCLSPADYEEFVFAHVKRLIERVGSDVPIIYFGTNTTTLLEKMRDTGADVIGLDWRVDLNHTWARLGHDIAVQGNLDPVTLFASPAEIRNRAKQVLNQAAARPGHIFNLGHGILPGTPVDHVVALVDAVHELSNRSA
jgi:uroporphyrinogen decarboxylase